MGIFDFFKKKQSNPTSSNGNNHSASTPSAEEKSAAIDSKDFREQYGRLCLTAIHNGNWDYVMSDLKNLANQDFAEAYVALGQYYSQYNREDAKSYFMRGAELGNAECAWGASGPLPFGYVPDINDKDKEWYKLCLQSAIGGCSDAMSELGNMYNRMDNHLAAYYWYQKAISYGNPRCSESNAKVIKKWEEEGKPALCKSIDGVPEVEFKSAYEIFTRIFDEEKFAEFVNIMALPLCMQDGNELLGLFMGDFYESVLKSPGNARIFYRTAAHNGGIYGAKCLADMMACGIGGDKDINGALDWYSHAAERGEPTSAFVMAQVALQQGNKALAAYWLNVSYRRGYEPAFEMLIKL